MKPRALSFVPFCEDEPVSIYRTDLPHWRQKDCTYFVTFRLADSIPTNVLHGWKLEQLAWLRAHGTASNDLITALLTLSSKLQFAFHKEFNRKLNTYLDTGIGACILKQADIATIVKGALHHFDDTRYDLGDFIIMPNHVHLLMRPYLEHPLEVILKSIKQFSSRAINQQLKREGTIWQRDSYDHIVRNETELRAYQSYIANNPAKANLPKNQYIHYQATYDLKQ